MMDFVLKMMDFALNMMDFVLKMMDFVLKMMDFGRVSVSRTHHHHSWATFLETALRAVPGEAVDEDFVYFVHSLAASAKTSQERGLLR